MTTQNPAQDVSDAALIEFSRIKLWFFRDLVDAQRKALFLLCGFSDAVTHGELDTHSAQLRALRHALRIDAARELQQAKVVGADVARLMELVYVPGAWRCPKCNLRLIASTLSMGDGGMYANNEPQECANGCGSMWRVTEREDRQEAQRFAIEQAEALTTPQSSAPVVGDEMVAKAYRVCEDFIEEHGDGYINDLDDGQWNEMLRAALESALTRRG